MTSVRGILQARILELVAIFLVGYSPLGHKESDTTERLTLSGLVFNSNFISLISFLHSFCIVTLLLILLCVILCCIYSYIPGLLMS